MEHNIHFTVSRDGLATVQAEAVRQRTQINETESLQLTRNLLRIAIFNISYIRGLFPENYFEDRYLAALEMNIKKLMPLDLESRRLIDWMEKGVYDALQKKYLKTLLFRLCEADDGPMIEEYAFSFKYSSSFEEVSMNIARSSVDGQQGKDFSTNSSDISPSQMKNAACKMVRTLVQLMRTLNNVPDEVNFVVVGSDFTKQRTIVLQLYYHDDVTPMEYEPPYFRSCTYEDDTPWSRTPLKMKVGDVNSKHYAISLKLKSVLDPCEDENDDIKLRDEEAAAVALSRSGTDNSPESSYSAAHSNSPRAASRNSSPILSFRDTGAAHTAAEPGEGQDCDKQREMEVDDDLTQDSEYENENAILVKQWALTHHNDEIDMAAFLQRFPEISVIHMRDLVRRLLLEGFLKMVDKDTYEVHQSVPTAQLLLKDMYRAKTTPEPNVQVEGILNDTQDNEELRLYKKALHNIHCVEYITVPQLHSILGADVKLQTVRKLIGRMTIEGYLEVSVSNRRLGRRVLRKPEADKPADKLLEIVKGVQGCVIDNSVNEVKFSVASLNEKSHHAAADNAGGLDLCLPALDNSGTYELKPSSPSKSPVQAQDAGPGPSFTTAQCSVPGPPISTIHVPGTSSDAVTALKTITDNPNGDSGERRRRKASKVEEPIFQMSGGKRMRS